MPSPPNDLAPDGRTSALSPCARVSLAPRLLPKEPQAAARCRAMSTVVWVPSPPNDHTLGGRTSAPPPCARVLTAAPSPTPPPFHTKNPSRRSLSYPSRLWRRCPRRQTFTRPAAAPPHRHCARACHQPHLAQRRRRPHEEPQAATCRHDHLYHGVGALAAERPCARRPHLRTVAVRACP